MLILMASAFMKHLTRRSTVGLTLTLLFGIIGFVRSQPASSESEAVRVIVKMNADDSRTVYKFNDAQHTCLAATTEQNGKLREKIQYQLDDAGRFASGQIFGADGKLRFKSRYKYDNAGRIEEEIQTDKSDAVLHKIVYSYDQNGRQTGYSIFDASGKLIGRTGGVPLDASAKPRKKK